MGVLFFGRGRGRRRRPGAGGDRHPPCPLCGYACQEHVPDAKGRAGERGQASVCRHCGAMLVTLSTGSFRPATPAEQFRFALGPYGEEWYAIRRCARHARILRTYGVDLSPEELR